MGNRITGGSSGKGSSSRKGGTRGGRSSKPKKKGSKGRSHTGGPRPNKGWSGPAGTKQVRGSNTTTPAKRREQPQEKKEAGRTPRQNRGSAEKQQQSQTERPTGQRTPPNKRKKEPKVETAEVAEGVSEPQVVISDDLHGPDRIEAFRSKADQMVVGERTVIHHAARYGIIRGMTWTVILSMLLFWLPIVGPATAGYVGGRKAGGPLRAVIAVMIPAMVMFVIFMAVSESVDMVPAGTVSGVDLNLDGMADLPAQAVPLLGGLEQSMGAWVASPPDVLFIMVAFAIVGGALSTLRRREEETVIEKVGIPLGELKERVLREEAEKQGEDWPGEPPSRWHPHKVIAKPVAAHDAMNEMVDDIARRVYTLMQSQGMVAGADGKRQRKRRKASHVSTGEEGPHFEDLVDVVHGTSKTETAPSRSRATRKGANAAPMTAAEAIVGDAEDWEVVNTAKGRRPIRVVHSSPVAMVTEHPIEELEDDGQAPPPVVYEEPQESIALPVPMMHVETKRRGILGRKRETVVYEEMPASPADVAAVTGPGIAADAPAHVVAASVHRNYERLPIVGSIYADMHREDDTVAYGSVKSLEEPTIHDTIEASNIASTAAKELAEMARYEEGPDMEPEEDDMPPETKAPLATEVDLLEPGMTVGELVKEVQDPRPGPEAEASSGPKRKKVPKSTARKVKHPTGALKSRKREVQEAEYHEDEAETAAAEWDGPETVEEEDLFNPRGLADDDGPPEGSDAWAEEERIAAIVREREEWDRL